MAELSIGMKARMVHVKRWQIVRVTREQNLAEHTLMVLLIAEEIARSVEIPETPEFRLSLMDWAIHHDIIEVVTGDLNTVIKSRIKGKAGLRAVDDIEHGICDRYDSLKASTPDLVKAVVKLGDLAEAITFLETEGIGDHASRVKTGLGGNFMTLLTECEVKWPEYKWRRAYKVPCAITIYE